MSTFKSSAFADNVSVRISSDDGASELTLVNGAYNLVGQGIGELNLSLPPGTYQLRQCIGTAESIQDIEIQMDAGIGGASLMSPLSFKLEGLKFASPAPIIGTTTFREVPMDLWKKPPNLIGKPGLRLVIRAPEPKVATIPPRAFALEHLQAEAARLRLETLKGEVVCNFPKVQLSDTFSETALFLRDLQLSPGHYVLVQTNTSQQGVESMARGRQRCLPIIVHPNFSPRVYLLSLIHEASQLPLGVNLDNASIMYWPTELETSPGQSDLTLLEAARKALWRGNAIGGYWGAAKTSMGEAVQAPMLALLDSYLLLANSTAPDVERPDVRDAIGAAGKAFGEDFPDVVALRCAINRRGVDTSDEQKKFEDTLGDIVLSAPPLLANSWRQLLIPGHMNAELSRLMPFPFIPELNGTWFTWTEEVGARKHAAISISDSSVSADGAKATPFDTEQALGVAARGLADLMKNQVVSNLVRGLCKLVADQETLPQAERLDPLVVQVINGLGTIQDRLMLDAFGAEELAESVLLGLRIPSDRLPDLLKSLTDTLRANDLLRSTIRQLAVSLGMSLLKTFGGTGRK